MSDQHTPSDMLRQSMARKFDEASPDGLSDASANAYVDIAFQALSEVYPDWLKTLEAASAASSPHALPDIETETIVMTNNIWWPEGAPFERDGLKITLV